MLLAFSSTCFAEVKFYSLNSQYITLIHKFKVKKKSSEFCSAVTVQSNRGHMAWCLQHHWSQPQGSLIDQVGQFLSFLLPLLQQDKTFKWIILSLTVSLLHRWEKDADRVLPPLQWGHGLCSLSRSVYQWIDWTFQLQVVWKLQLVISTRSSTQEHPIFLSQFSSPLLDRGNMLLSCCSVFKATFPWLPWSFGMAEPSEAEVWVKQEAREEV